QAHRYFPGRSIDLGIFDDCLVVYGVLVDSRKALDDMQVLALRNRSHPLARGVGRHIALVVVVGDVHDQGITVPASPRIAVPKANARSNIPPPADGVKTGFRDGARDNGEVPRALQTLVPRAIPGGETPAWNTPRDAAFPAGEVHPVVLEMRQPVVSFLLRPRHDRHSPAG